MRILISVLKGVGVVGSCTCLAGVFLGALPAAAEPAVAPGASTSGGLSSSGVETEKNTLARAMEIIQKVQEVLQGDNADLRRTGLDRVARDLAPLAQNEPASVVLKLRAALESTINKVKPDNATVITVMDEQARWKTLGEDFSRQLTLTGQLLDALRLMHKASQDESHRLPNLLQAEFALQAMATEDARVKRCLEQIRRLIASVPPPAVFANADGLEMDLLEGGAAYISRQPVTQKQFVKFLAESGIVDRRDELSFPPPGLTRDAATGKYAAAAPDAPVTGLSWHLANVFCKWLTQHTGTPYALPSLLQLRNSTPRSDVALWSSTEAEAGSDFEHSMRSRFNVPFLSIWDPGKRVSDKDVVAELPLASYPGLGLKVTTLAEAAAKARILDVRKELNLQVPAKKPVAN